MTLRTDSYLILKHFTFAHLPHDLATISKPFCELAFDMAERLPFNPETSTALRKLLEAKDAAVRSAVEARPLNSRTGAAAEEDFLGPQGGYEGESNPNYPEPPG